MKRKTPFSDEDVEEIGLQVTVLLNKRHVLQPYPLEPA